MNNYQRASWYYLMSRLPFGQLWGKPNNATSTRVQGGENSNRHQSKIEIKPECTNPLWCPLSDYEHFSRIKHHTITMCNKACILYMKYETYTSFLLEIMSTRFFTIWPMFASNDLWPHFKPKGTCTQWDTLTYWIWHLSKLSASFRALRWGFHIWPLLTWNDLWLSR